MLPKRGETAGGREAWARKEGVGPQAHGETGAPATGLQPTAIGVGPALAVRRPAGALGLRLELWLLCLACVVMEPLRQTLPRFLNLTEF